MKKILSVIILLSAFLSTNAFSQAYPLPKFTVHITGGYGVPTGDFKMDIPPSTPLVEANRPDADNFPYYTKQLVVFGADGKLSLGARGNARVTFGIDYNMFSNNADGVFRIDAANTLAVTTFKPKVNVLSVQLGGEYAFQPTQKVNPFVGAALAANFFSGSFEFGREVRVKGVQRTGPMDMKSETRIGIVLNAGLDFRLSPQIGAVIGIKYHLINPIGKGADDETEIGANEIDLGDKEHVIDDGTTQAARSLSSFNGYAGISFFFGMLHK